MDNLNLSGPITIYISVGSLLENTMVDYLIDLKGKLLKLSTCQMKSSFALFAYMSVHGYE